MSDAKKWQCDTQAMDMFYRILPKLGYELRDEGAGRCWVRTQDVVSTTQLTLEYLEALRQSRPKEN